ncbi:hypothetical protein [Enterovirga aerilata]|uniref:Uncharacterized protein n=1 Tax=Enterovirga aerilata TaxID=2730920 RepID=A0A849ICQ1_9HYPH|nr:hypothetical protein [Enterovirga sp. DB1703]NNM74199.1 hypothetical protein [Enterovirga sp. DB1703]
MDVTLHVPGLGNITDEDIGTLTPMRDGRWSAQTKALLAEFKTNRLDLNSAWAATWTGWTCPCCGRGKPEIARVSAGGVLLCRLERHHDHLADLAHSIFDRSNPKTNDPRFNLEADRARDALTILVERFEPAVLCLDCNLAEGIAKQALRNKGLPSYFTFKPSEIADFVSASPNRVHEIDLEAAEQTWLASKDDLASRDAFLTMMVSRVTAGLHRREIARGRQPEPLLDRDVVFRLFSQAAPKGFRFDLASAVEARSVSRDSSSNSSRVRRRRPSAAPSDAEFAAVEAEQRPGRTWVSAGEDWTCPCCSRSKRAICRRSNSGRWTAQIFVVHEYQAECEAENLAHRQLAATAAATVGSHRAILICQDCRNITTRLRQQAPDLDEACLTPGNIRDLAGSPTANADHDVDLTRAMTLARANADHCLAVADYHRHRVAAAAALADVALRVRLGLSYEAAISGLARDVDEARGLNTQQAAYHAAWLLAEGQRFKDLDLDAPA